MMKYRYLLEDNLIKETNNYNEWFNDYYCQSHLLDINQNKAFLDFEIDGNFLDIVIKDRDSNNVLKSIVSCDNYKEYAEESDEMKALHFTTDTLLHCHIRYNLDLEGLKDDIRQYFN